MKRFFIVLVIISLLITSCGKASKNVEENYIDEVVSSSEISISSSTIDTLEESTNATVSQVNPSRSTTVYEENAIQSSIQTNDTESDKTLDSPETTDCKDNQSISTQLQKENSLQTTNNHLTISSSGVSLTEEQVNNIAYDLVAYFSLFAKGTLTIKENDALGFVLYLISQTSEENIKDNYVSNLYSYISQEYTKVVEGKINGQYVKTLMKAIFDFDIMPEKDYDFFFGDPAPFGLDLKSFNNTNDSYYAIYYLCDVDGSPNLEIDMTFSLSSHGNIKIGEITMKELEDTVIQEANSISSPSIEK